MAVAFTLIRTSPSLSCGVGASSHTNLPSRIEIAFIEDELAPPRPAPPDTLVQHAGKEVGSSFWENAFSMTTSHRLLLVGLLARLALAAPGEFRLDKPFDASVALDARLPSVRLRFDNQPVLRVSTPKKMQEIPLDTVADELKSAARGAVLVRDFDFDGRKDLGIPSGVGYGGVNVFYTVYRYQPASDSFLPVGGKDFPVCNPEFSERAQVLLTNSRSGPMWYGLDYKFKQGKPWIFRRRSPVLLEDLLQGPDLLTLFETHSPQGKLIQSSLSCDSTQPKPVRAVLKQDLPTSKLPGARGLSGLLRAGQTVTLDRVERYGSHLYVQAAAGWIMLPDGSVHR